MIEWLGDQLRNPLTAAAVAFVAGGIFTALVDLVGRELTASRNEERARRRSLLDHRLKIVRRTISYIWAVNDYVEKRSSGIASSYLPEDYADSRLRYIGDADVGNRFFDTVVELLGEPRAAGITPDQGVRLSDAREAVLEELERQEERLMEGRDPLVLPFGAIDEAGINRRITESQARLQQRGQSPG